MQIRGIEDVSAVSVLGTVGMLVALTIAAIKICLTPRIASYRYGAGFAHSAAQYSLSSLSNVSGNSELLASRESPHLMQVNCSQRM